jgi:hypothetical protein
MNANLPIDASSLQKAVFFHYSAENLPLEKIVFLMKESFPMDTVNIRLLETLTQSGGFAGKLTETVSNLANLEPKLQGQILDKLIPALEISAPEFAKMAKAAQENSSDLRGIAEAITKYLPIAIKNKNSLEGLTDYFKNLHKALFEAEKLLAQAEGTGKTTNAGAQGLREEAALLRQSLEFMDHIGNYKHYLQIPLYANGATGGAELFVFKEPKKNKNLKERASILIALDCPSIGRVETFVECAGKALRFQFRALYPETLKLLSASFGELEARLAESGYQVAAASFKNLGESFAITDDLAQAADSPAEKKRYSFDMRV